MTTWALRPCAFLKVTRAKLPSGPDWFAHKGPGEEGNEESTHRKCGESKVVPQTEGSP